MYRDSDGNECDLATMCRREPGWAASRIAVMTARLEVIGDLLARNGCDCDCDHDAESHDAHCKRCLACRIEQVLHVR